MLAKELKIQNLKRQREFIDLRLQEYLKNPPIDGGVTFTYYGKLFPETISYFTSNGFNVSCLTVDSAANTRFGLPVGLPIYCFSVSDDIALTDEELKIAEKVKYQPPEKDISIENTLQFLRAINLWVKF